MTTTEQKHCKPCEGIGQRLTPAQVSDQLKTLQTGWEVASNNLSIQKDFKFKNYYQTMAFVNAIAWISHYENHHPDLEVGYNHCLVRYSTHAIHGLSENDFICAAQVDAIIQPAEERLYGKK